MYNYTLEALCLLLLIISLVEWGIIEHQDNTIDILKRKIDYIINGKGGKY